MWFMQTKLLGVTLGLLLEGGAQPGSVARCGHVRVPSGHSHALLHFAT